MAEHPVLADEIGVHELILTPNTEEEIRFADDVDEVEILSHDGAAAVYFTVDGTAATVKGTTCRVLPASISSAMVQPPTAGPTTIRLISAGTPSVSVTRT
jgi:hypothetical protein